MKRVILPFLLSFAIVVACPLSGKTGAGSQVSSLLSDPQVGLAGLENYHANLKVTFQGTNAGQTINKTDGYDQTEWPKLSAQFTAMDTTDAGGAEQFMLAGSVGQAQYFQADNNSPCTASWGETAGGPSDFLVASILPVVGTAKLADTPTINGIATSHYTFDATSLNLPSDATASGEAWIAQSGGYVVKYILDIKGSDSIFGTGVQGTRHLEYNLSDVGAHPDVVYPVGCEPVLTEVPAMDDASDLTRLPGLLAFSTGATSDAIFSFYQDKLTALGWQKSNELGEGTDSILVTYNRPGSNGDAAVEVDIEGGSTSVIVTVPLSGTAAASTTSQGTTPAASSASTNTTVRIMKALNILLGSETSPSALASFHLDAVNQSPVWAGGQIAQSQDTMIADVQGANVHFADHTKSPDGSETIAEAYLIGKQEYDVQNGQVQPPGVSMTGLSWRMWPMNLMILLATGSTGATAAGTETLDGRIAEIDEINVSGSSIPSVAGIALSVSSVSGKVWVDQQTGALLKAVLDYQADVHDTAGADKGNGAGHLELTVTKVGQVTVSVPNQ